MGRFIRRAEGDAGRARRVNKLAAGRNRLEVGDGLLKRDCNNVCGLKCDHHAALALHQRAYGARAEVGRQHTIERVRRAAALQVAEHYTARLLARQIFKRAATVFSDSAQARRASGVALLLVDRAAAALQVAEHYTARLLARQIFKRAATVFSDSAQARRASGVALLLVDRAA